MTSYDKGGHLWHPGPSRKSSSYGLTGGAIPGMHRYSREYRERRPYYRRYGRRSYRKKRFSNARTGGFLNIEKKFMDTELVSTVFPTSWETLENATMLCLNAIGQGFSEELRVGRKFFIHSIHIKGEVKLPRLESQVAPDEKTHCRWMLVLDTQTNAAQLAATNVMDTGGTNDVLAFRKLDRTSRFKILKSWDKIITPNNMNEGAVNLFAKTGTIVRWKYDKQFSPPLKIECITTGATVSAITDHSLHIIAITGNAGVTMQYQCRVRFTD